jgi:hypothetical protein
VTLTLAAVTDFNEQAELKKLQSAHKKVKAEIQRLRELHEKMDAEEKQLQGGR